MSTVFIMCDHFLKNACSLLLCLLLLTGCSARNSVFGSDAIDIFYNQEETEMKTIYLAGGCFWGVQKYFNQFNGVISTEVGYANGPDIKPTYQEVCDSSGHAETVKVVYDENRIDLTELLNYYFMVIDPLSVNKQGNDRGIQYRTGIYYTENDQLSEIESVYQEQELKAGAKLAVELEPLRNFFTAEEYHQKYLDKNPGGYCHIPNSLFSLEERRAAERSVGEIKQETPEELKARIGYLSYENLEKEGYGDYKKLFED